MTAQAERLNFDFRAGGDTRSSDIAEFNRKG
jgi:hypothetical protein